MRTKLLIAIVGVVVLGWAAPASAKGPSEGVLEGDGLDQAIVIGYGEGAPGAGDLIGDVGFFEVTFGSVPRQALDDAPTDDLGPRLRLTWTVPGPDGEDDLVVQDIYPYAAGGPVTYTAPGQPFFESEQTVGGWFRAPNRLLASLQALGLPDERDLSVGGHGGGTRWAPIGGSLVAMLVLGAGLAVFGRRSAKVAPAAG